MPVIIRFKGYKFFFFSNEGSPREPIHVHIRKGNCLAKIWLEPTVAIAETFGFTGKELTLLTKIIEINSDLIKRSWNEFFSN